MEDKEDLSKENQGGATYDRFASSLTWQRQGKRTESELDESKMESKSWRQSERDKASDIGSDDEVILVEGHPFVQLVVFPGSTTLRSLSSWLVSTHMI